MIGAIAPTPNPPVRPWYSYDGTNLINDKPIYVVQIESVNTMYYYLYDTIPLAAVSAGFTITNG